VFYGYKKIKPMLTKSHWSKDCCRYFTLSLSICFIQFIFTGLPLLFLWFKLLHWEND